MRVCLLPVLVATWMPSVFGLNIELYPPSPQVNQTVIFNVLGLVGQIRDLNWYRGPDTRAANQFLRMDAAGNIYIGTLKIEKASLFPNGSLQITDVQKADEGEYTIGVQLDSLLQATVSLSLREPNGQGGIGGGGIGGGGIGGGAIAGIVIGVLAAVGAVTGLAAYFYTKKSHRAAPIS